MRRQNGLDYIKGLACIAVVLIHYNFPGGAGIAVRAFCRFAVPVFLCVSGYFFLRKGSMDDAAVVRKIRHISSLLAMAGLFYFLVTWVWVVVLGDGTGIQPFIQEKLSAGSIVKFFVTNDPFVYSHLWFLMGLIYCYVFALFFFAGNRRFRAIYILAPVLLVCYALLQEFAALLGICQTAAIPGTEDRLYLFNLFCFRALPFFLFGMIFKAQQERLSALPLRGAHLWLLAVLGGVIAAAERFMIGESQYFIGSYITAATLFIWALKSNVRENHPLCFIGRELSLYVYIFHVAVGKCFEVLSGKLAFLQNIIGTIGQAPFVLPCSILAAYVMYRMLELIKERRR